MMPLRTLAMRMMTLAKIGALIGAWVAFGSVVAVVLGAILLLWLLLASEPDWLG